MSLPRRTLAFCAVIDWLARPALSQKSLAQIQRTRRLQPPHKAKKRRQTRSWWIELPQLRYTSKLLGRLPANTAPPLSAWLL